MVRRTATALLLTFLAACATVAPDAPAPAPAAGAGDAAAPDHEALLRAARADWSSRGDEASAIWVGRRLAYLGRYEDAVAWYGARLAEFPNSYRLLRHRGHRWITLRRFERAQADLERAWELARLRPDEVEPDGLPNARGVPTGTDRTNILYHLALAHYLQGEFEEARDTWALCQRAAIEGAPGFDSRVASAYWHHVSGARLADGDGAARADLARDVPADLDIVENHAYHELCLLLTGRLEPTALTAASDGVQDATRLYGLARWHAERGEQAESRRLLERIVEQTPRAAFGHIAAEAELDGFL